jgi:hypothetical protein
MVTRPQIPKVTNPILATTYKRPCVPAEANCVHLALMLAGMPGRLTSHRIPNVDTSTPVAGRQPEPIW